MALGGPGGSGPGEGGFGGIGGGSLGGVGNQAGPGGQGGSPPFNTPYYNVPGNTQQRQAPQGFQINPQQVQNDIQSAQWGWGSSAGPTDPAQYVSEASYSNLPPNQQPSAPPFDWGGFFQLFGGK